MKLIRPTAYIRWASLLWLAMALPAAAATQVVVWGGDTNLPSGLTNVVAIASGDGFNLALKGDGSVVSWNGTNVTSPGLSNIVAIAAGYDFGLGLKSDGTVAAWGGDGSGQLDIPPGLSNVVSIAAGWGHGLAVKADGVVVGWGYDYDGEADAPPGLNQVTAVAAGEAHSIALRADGTVAGWGDDSYGQTDVPTNLANVTAIASGEFFNVALRANGTVAAWGTDDFGETDVPSNVTNATAIAARDSAGLALGQDDTLYTWGNADPGQFDNFPSGLTNIMAIALGWDRGLAIVGDGSPFILQQPLGQAAYLNSTVTFSVTVKNAAGAGYQWLLNSTNLPDATNAMLVLAGVQPGDAGDYQVLVTNALGSARSFQAQLTINTNQDPPVFVDQFGKQLAPLGGNASIFVGVIGAVPLSYQWSFNGADLPGATNAALVLTNLQLGQTGDYTVVVTNAYGSNRAVCLFAITSAPIVIVTQPLTRTVGLGSSPMVSVAAQGTPPLGYLWYFNDTNLLQAGPSNTLVLTNFQPAQTGNYSVIITNLFAGAVSAEATLTISTDMAWSFPTEGYVVSSPAIADDGTIYIGSGDANIYALNPDGTVRWTFPTGEEIQSSPAIGADNTIYIGSGDGALYAVTTNGTLKWKFQTGDYILSSPTLGVDGTIYINSRDGKCYAVNPDGTQQWSFDTGDYYNDMLPVIGPDSTIYLGTGSKVQALDRHGRKLWEAPVGGGDMISVVIGKHGVVYATSSGFGMKMVALTYNGQKLWEFPFGSPTDLGMPSYPAIGRDGTIYVATSDWNLYAINPDGSLKWSVPATSSQSSPALSTDGKIYLNSDWDFTLLRYSTNGTLEAQLPLGNGPVAVGSGSSSFPTLLHDVLYFGSGNGNVYAFHANGELEAGCWPAFGHDHRHSGRDTQRRIDATINPTNGIDELQFVVETNLSYRLQGSTNMLIWVDCTNFTSTNAFVTLPKPPGFPYFRLATP